VKALLLRAERLYLAEHARVVGHILNSRVPFSSLLTEVPRRGILRSSYGRASRSRGTGAARRALSLAHGSPSRALGHLLLRGGYITSGDSRRPRRSAEVRLHARGGGRRRPGRTAPRPSARGCATATALTFANVHGAQVSEAFETRGRSVIRSTRAVRLAPLRPAILPTTYQQTLERTP
jgi:hypothetical protein